MRNHHCVASSLPPPPSLCEGTIKQKQLQPQEQEGEGGGERWGGGKRESERERKREREREREGGGEAKGLCTHFTEIDAPNKGKPPAACLHDWLPTCSASQQVHLECEMCFEAFGVRAELA